MTRITASMDGLAGALGAAEDAFAKISTDAMREATVTLKGTLRGQILDAGMGQRLANTWQGDTYPTQGNSVSPVGWVYSKAPDIVTAFASGATIQPANGGNYLWIPTKNVPRALGRSSARKMTPAQVLATFRTKEFIIRNGRNGRKLAFIADKLGTTARGGRKKVRRGRLAHGSDSELVLMFTLTPSVNPGKRFDLDAAAQAGAADFAARIQSETV